MEQDNWVEQCAAGVECVGAMPSVFAPGTPLLEIPRRGFPVAQFDESGNLRHVVSELFEIAADLGRSTSGVSIMQWLLGPTLYLDGARPFDLLLTDPDRVTWTARNAWGAQW